VSDLFQVGILQREDSVMKADRLREVLKDRKPGEIITMEEIEARLAARYDNWTLTPYEIRSLMLTHFAIQAGSNTFRIREGVNAEVENEEERGESDLGTEDVSDRVDE
jgi:hypothetical protein